MKEMKRILSLFLCLVMLVGYLPVGALATEGDAATDTSALGVVAETTVPETTVPETTVPETTVPETTVPETTVPETTEETEPVKTPVRKPARKPVTNVSKEATGTNTENVLDAAIFFSDLHTTKGNYKTEEIGAVFGQMQETGLKFSSVTSVGDAFSSGYPAYADSTSNVTNVIQGVLGDVPVYYVWSDHDRGADIENFTGLLYGDDSTNYYIYAISMTDMMEGSRFADVKSTFDESKLTAFTETVAELDPSKPLFVVTHVPLHDRRDDNQYADEWYGVISAAAKKMDVAVFWGHNHTQEAAADLNGYYIAKNGSETITIDGVGSVVPNFTYVNAGYMNDSGLNSGDTCEYVSTIVKITEDSVIYTLYDEDGVHTCSNHSNATVTREFKDAVRQEPEQPSEPAVTLESIAVTAAPTKTAYVVDETFDAAGLVVTATYSDGTTAPVAAEVTAPDMTTAGTKTVTVTFEGKTASFEITVTEPEPSEPEASEPAASEPEASEPETSTVQDPENQQITVTAPGATAVTATVLTDAALEAAKAAVSEVLGGNVVAYEIEVAGFVNESGTASVTLPIPEGVINPAVYHVDGENIEKMPTVKNDDGTLTFTTTHFSTFTVGEDTEIEVEDPKDATVSKTETIEETKTVYKLIDSFDGSGNYLISNTNSATTDAHLLTATNNGVSDSTATVIVDTDANITYIEDPATTAIWSATSNSNGFRLRNTYLGRYLRYSDRYGGYLTTDSSNSTTWYSETNAVHNNARYLRYNDEWTTSGNSRTVYLYKETEVTFETSTTITGTYSIEGDPSERKLVVANGTSLQLGANLIFTPESGEPTSEPVNAIYTEVANGDPNNVLTVTSNGAVTFSGAYGKALIKVSYDSGFGEVTNYITLEAAAPYYTLEICEPKTVDGTTTYEPITETVTKKGVKAGDTLTVWPELKLHDANNQDGAAVQNPKITWEVSNTNIATISEAGVITFTGKEYGAFNVTAKYLDADNKLLCEDTITVSVSKNEFVVPEDGTDDFPEYPNQGAVRIDKTAEAVGNFSQTGTSKVELAMTGVPYGANVKTDVIVVVDMTNSMDANDVTAAEKAVQQLVQTLVYDSENEKYDANMRIYVDTFSSGSTVDAVKRTTFLDGTQITNADELNAAMTAIAAFSERAQQTGSGTRYDVGMQMAMDRVNQAGHAENQFVVFVSDGAASAYSPLINGVQGTTILGPNQYYGLGTIDTSSWFDSTGAIREANFRTEFYSHQIKTAGIPVYTIGVNMTDGSSESWVLNHMSSNYSPDGKTATGETDYNFNCDTENGAGTQMQEIFKGIGMSIREAATNVVVQDEVGEKYTLTFGVPTGVDAADTGMEEFYIQAVEYTLDPNTNQRTGDPVVLEKFTFDQNSTLKSHTVKGIACGETCTHVTMSGTTVTAINGTYFQYSTETATNDQGQEYTKEFITWTADKISRTELALQYFAYLDNSAGTGDASKQVEAGTYYTNEEATVTYDNYQGERVQQTFPQPSMTWKGAKVTYLFYLVNEAGQPVNRAGKVIPFAEAIYVTEPVTYDVTWNDMEGAENILARNVLASSGVPDVYELYDTSAAYEIRVYQTEGVDNNAVNYNYFSIAGSSDKLIDDILDDDDLVDNSTTKVFNTKSGQKYDEYGVYSKQDVGTVLNTTDANGNATTVKTTVKAVDIDYANTTVAFAVVWDASLVPDTVVMDYGLDVVIDVTTNDALESVVTGVSATPVNDVEMNSGSYAKSAMGTFANIGVIDGANNNYIGHAMKENNTSVRFRLDYSDGAVGDQGYGMQFKEPVDFYYESLATYYTYEEGVDKPEPHTQYMYSKVTVIPATSIYYEDSFVTFTNSANMDEENGYGIWTPVGTGVGATQAQDRPGVSKISEKLDADNNYGYDAAYSEMSQYSLGSAMMVKVKENVSGMASFDFYGTGFDVISMTSNTTGTIIVRVYDGEEMVWDGVVDTYYGYNYNESTGVWEVVDSASDNALYQVPVIKVTGLPYGPKYTAKIVASYIPMLDHTTDAGYEFYMDAVRIYDPTGNKNEVANDAYIADHEAYPVYRELRNNVIAASDFVAGEVNGIVFIDSNGENMSVADYVSYGPNNELYLAAGQAVAFGLDLTAYEGIVDKVQLGMKSADGTDLKYLLIDTTAINEKMEAAKLKAEAELLQTNPNATLDEINTAKDEKANDIFEKEWEAAKQAGNAVTLKTSTDMYYDITSLKDKAIIIYNEGAGIMSLTNIKLTFTADPGAVGDLFYVDFDTIQNILDRQNALNKDVTAEPDEETALTGVSVTLPAYVKSGNEITIYIDVPEGTEIATVSVNGAPAEVSVDEDEGRAYVTVMADTVDGITTTEKQQNLVIIVTDKDGKTATVNARTTVYNFQPTIVAVTPTTAKHGEVVTIQVTTSKNVAALEIDGNMLASYRDTDAGRIWTTQKTFKNTTSGNITETVLITAYSETGYDYVYEGYEVQITPQTTTVAQSVRNVVSSIAKALRSLFKNK